MALSWFRPECQESTPRESITKKNLFIDPGLNIMAAHWFLMCGPAPRTVRTFEVCEATAHRTLKKVEKTWYKIIKQGFFEGKPLNMSKPKNSVRFVDFWWIIMVNKEKRVSSRNNVCFWPSFLPFLKCGNSMGCGNIWGKSAVCGSAQFGVRSATWMPRVHSKGINY